MILNAYAVLDAFLTLLRLGIGLLTVAFAVAAWRSWRQAGSPEGREAALDRTHLLFLLAGLLLCLNVASWPIFYLLLQSYVPEWPGVMCIYGVTRIGAGSVGAARFLPPLVTALQATKPALVFASGSWFVLHLLNRRTRTAPLTGRVLALLLVAGLLGVGDAIAEAAYLAIPKKEEVAATGCCTEAFDTDTGASRFLPRALTGPEQVPLLYALYYGVNGVTVLGLAAYGWSCRGRRVGWLAPLLLATACAAAVSALFLVEVAAPRLIRLPEHHCPYDLVPLAPESLVAVALFVGAGFAVGWACVAGWLGRSPETEEFVPATVVRLVYLAALGYLASVAMLSVELALA